MTNVTFGAVEVQAGTAVPGLAVSATFTHQTPPTEMRERRQWVAFKLEPRPGQPKPAKVPYKTADQRAKATDPADWLTYAAAVALAEDPGFAGVGYVFAPDDGLVGIDLDGARDPATGTIEPWARAIVDRLGSYTEVSPSGTGLHVIVRGAITAAVKTKRVEIYDRARYFTVTGQVIPEHDTIADAPDLEAFAAEHRTTPSAAKDGALPPVRAADLTDDALLARLAASKDAKAFHRLHVAGETRPNHSQSEDDFELACLFARHVGGDADRIERLLRSSALADRAKWDRADYLARTIRAAMRKAGGDASATVERERGALLTFADLLTLPTLPWLIEGLFPAEGVTVVYGSYAAYKSFVVLDWLAAVAGGVADWFGLPIRKHGAAVYVYAEGRAGLGQRAQAVKLARHLSDALPLVVRPIPLNVADPAAVDQLIADISATLKDAAPAVIAIDTLARNMPGGDENKQQDMNAFVGGCDRLRTAFGCQVLVVHHENKDGAMRGSTVAPGAADTLIEVKRQADLESRLTVTKQKDGEQPTWTVRLRPEAASLVVASVEAIGEHAKPAVTATDWWTRGRTEGRKNGLFALYTATRSKERLRMNEWIKRAGCGASTVASICRELTVHSYLVEHVVKKRPRTVEYELSSTGITFAESVDATWRRGLDEKMGLSIV